MRISVVIPVLNGGEAFGRCLKALWGSNYKDWECIVVDDGSTDCSRQMAKEFGAIVIDSERPNSGPARARNLGVKKASGDVLFFTDADVLVRPETLAQVAAVMEDTSITACIGSYDDQPTENNFLSQYRNLLHHFTHQQANREAATFWSGCGAIRRDVFLELEGFNEAYGRPSIEDIELGYRLRARGYRIVLEKTLQVSHMKKWRVSSMLLTDIRDRAIPWAKLMLVEGEIFKDLNLARSQQISSVVGLIGLGFLILSLVFPWLLAFYAMAMFLLLILNRRFYLFLFRKRGVAFVLLALPWHWLYFVYSGLSFGICYLFYGRRKQPLQPI